jgi:hypothetical protein
LSAHGAIRGAARIWAVSAIVVASLLLTLTRIPLSRGDGPFYASIALADAYGQHGVPSTLDPGAATAIDHIRFYGPMYFGLVQTSFSLFGVSLASFRAIGLLGVLLAAAGGVFISKVLGGGPERRAWTWVLLLLTPEVGTASSSGRMDSLAVGFELCGLAIFLDGLIQRKRPWVHGAAAAAFLCAAMLTTPRTFPFMLGFALAMLFVLPREVRTSREIRIQAAATLAVAAAIMLAWMVVSSGSPARWFRLMETVATRENTDVAILPGGQDRDLMFVWWQSITLVFSMVGAAVAGVLLAGDRSVRGIAMTFGLIATWTTLVVTMTLFNFTFFFCIYSVLPLMAVVIALPTPLSDSRRRGAALVAVMLFALLIGVRAARIAHGAITWDGRDDALVERFITYRVPPGSRVLGPGDDYLFPVERSGSRYLAVPQVSAADWARWVQSIEPRQLKPVPLRGDFLLWRIGDAAPPRELACRARLLDTFEPPPPTFPSLIWLVAGDPYAEYPRMRLYALDDQCGP